MQTMFSYEAQVREGKGKLSPGPSPAAVVLSAIYTQGLREASARSHWAQADSIVALNRFSNQNLGL